MKNNTVAFKRISIFFITLIMLPLFSLGSVQSVAAASARYCTDGYDGSSYQETVTENITYTRKEDTEYGISAGLPKYMDGTSLQNICAVLAGATIIGYYDRFKENLIPDFTPTRIIQNKVIYINTSPKIQELITSLYSLMGSNSSGTTLSGFKIGMTTYIGSHGGSISYNAVGNNFAAIQTHVEGENLVTLFMDKKFNFVTGILTNGTTDTIMKELYSGYHVGVVYGYRIIRYFDGDTLIAERKFFKASTGHASCPLAYIAYDSSVIVGDALCVTIR